VSAPSNSSSSWQHKRAKLARLSRDLPRDAPEVEDARRDLKAQRLEEHVAKVVAEAPPLTPEQKERIAALLRAGAA
jgi:hypothetical protein